MSKFKFRWPVLSAGTIAGFGLAVTLMAAVYSHGQAPPTGDPFHPAGGSATTSASTPATTSELLNSSTPAAPAGTGAPAVAAPTGAPAVGAVTTTTGPVPQAPVAPAAPGVAAVTTTAAPVTTTTFVAMLPATTSYTPTSTPWCRTKAGDWYFGTSQGCTPNSPNFVEYRWS